MLHYAGYVPRFHPSDFHTHSADGVGADWPIEYAELRPYYEQIEAERAAAALAAAHNLQVSAHCAPALHVPVAASITNLRHLEYFIDHPPGTDTL